MAKRCLCMLLAAVTLFSLCVPAIAAKEPAETPVPTEEPVVTEEPVEVTKGPAPTEVPVEETEEPAVTEEPVEVTEEPVVTEEPAPTKEPIATEEPVAVKEPEITEAPEPVQEPEVTVWEPAAVSLEDEPMPVADTSGSCGPKDESGSYSDSVQWSFVDGTLTISGTEQMADYDGGSPWDEYKSTIKTVAIQPGVTSIGSYAFSECASLTSVTIPVGVTAIGDDAFRGCISLAEVTIPSSMTSIGDYVFSGCTALTSVVVDAGATSIGGQGAFFGCTALASVTIPDSVTSIGKDGTIENLFESSPSVTIFCSAFSFAHNWARGYGLQVALSDPEASVSGDYGMSLKWSLTAGGMFTLSGTGDMLKYYPWDDYRAIIRSVKIENGVTSIGDSAFSECVNLTDVTIPESVTSIGSDAFRNCKSLTEATIPEGVTSIRSQTFYCCKSLKSVTIPESVLTIEFQAFVDCVSLTDLVLPKGVTNIADSAFLGCCGLTSVTIPESVTSIGTYAFLDCTGFVSLSIPEGVISIKSGAFSGCTSLEDLTLPESLVNLGNGAFIDCIKLTSVTVPCGVTFLGSAFYGCTSLADLTVLNPNCEFLDDDILLNKNVVIVGYDGSTAEEYAYQYGYIFKSLGPVPTPEPTVTPEPTSMPTPEPTPEPTAEPTATPEPTPEPTAKPAQPKVSKVTNTADGIKITWNAVSGAEHYTVYYKTGTGKWKKLAATAETSYTWTRAKSGTKYSFSVRAQNSIGNSGYNKTGKSITYVAQPKVKSAKIDASGVKITWGKVTGATKYQVMYKTGTGKWKVLVKSVTGTSYTWKKAKSGTKYSFSVRAIAKDGSTGAYNETGKSLTYVSAPKVKSAKKVSGGIKLTWAKVNGAAKYQVMYKVGNGKWKALTTTDKRTFTWKKAKNGVKYTFSVRAVASDGTKGVYNTTGKSLTYKK